MTGPIEARKGVLIVDDSSTMRAMLDGIFANDSGFKVVGLARSAKEAMVLLQTEHPHIVLTDLCMPEIDGAELLTMLARRISLCKVVVSTKVNLSDAMHDKLSELGAAAIFDKQEIARHPQIFLAALRRAVAAHGGGVGGLTAPALESKAPRTSTANAPPFPMPDDEVARARAVRTLKITNLDVDPRLNILARHLSRLSNYPIAAVNVIGTDHLWIKAAVGIAPGIVLRGESICAHAICADGVTVVGDTLADPTFRTLPAVTGGPRLRSYVGAPIVAEQGARLGMVCIADTRVRCPTQAELDVVTDVAALVACALQTPIPQLRPAA